MPPLHTNPSSLPSASVSLGASHPPHGGYIISSGFTSLYGQFTSLQPAGGDYFLFMMSSADAKPFLRQKKAHPDAATKSTGGFSKKAHSGAHHNQKQDHLLPPIQDQRKFPVFHPSSTSPQMVEASTLEPTPKSRSSKPRAKARR